MVEKTLDERVDELTQKLAPKDIAYILEARNDIGSSMNVDDRVKTAVQRLSEHYLLKDYIAEVYFKENKKKPEEYNKFRLKAIAPADEEKKARLIGKSTREGDMFYAALDSDQIYIPNYDHPFLKDSFNIHNIPLNSIGRLLLDTKKEGLLEPKLKDFLEEYKRNCLLIQIKHAIDYENNSIAATKDSLTGLYSYQFFENSLKKEAQIEMRNEIHKEGLSLILLDLDNFKKYNDMHGHQRGDEVLKEVGKILNSKIRETDIAARAKQGDEFAIILPTTSIEDAKQKAESIQGIIKLHNFAGEEKSGKITASFGIANIPRHATTSQDLIELADKALYNSKNKGRNRISVYSPSF